VDEGQHLIQQQQQVLAVQAVVVLTIQVMAIMVLALEPQEKEMLVEHK
jgi:hypothetical protein